MATTNIPRWTGGGTGKATTGKPPVANPVGARINPQTGEKEYLYRPSQLPQEQGKPWWQQYQGVQIGQAQGGGQTPGSAPTSAPPRFEGMQPGQSMVGGQRYQIDPNQSRAGLPLSWQPDLPQSTDEYQAKVEAGKIAPPMPAPAFTGTSKPLAAPEQPKPGEFGAASTVGTPSAQQISDLQAQNKQLAGQLPAEQQGNIAGLPDASLNPDVKFEDTLRYKYKQFMGNPLVSRVIPAVQMGMVGLQLGGLIGVTATVGTAGAAAPLLLSAPVLGLAGFAYGFAAGQKAFDQNTILGRVLSPFAIPAAKLEQAIGVGAQLYGSATEPEKYGTLAETLGGLAPSKVEFHPEALFPKRISLEKGVEWNGTPTDIVRVWSATAEAGQLTYEAAPVDIRALDPTRLNPDAKGEMHTVPLIATSDAGMFVDYDVPTTIGGITALVEARRAIQERTAAGMAPQDATESVLAEMSGRFGVAGEVRNLVGQMALDPLNALPFLENKAMGALGEFGPSNPLLKEARAAIETAQTLEDKALAQRTYESLYRQMANLAPEAPIPARPANDPLLVRSAQEVPNEGAVGVLAHYRDRTLLQPLREGVSAAQQLNALQRMLVGEKMLALADTGTYTAPKATLTNPVSWLTWLMRETPQSMAFEHISQSGDTLTTLLSRLPADENFPRTADQIIHGLKAADPDNLPAELDEVNRLRASVQGRAVKWSLPDNVSQDLLNQWELTAPHRDILNTAAKALGETPASLIERIAKKGEGKALADQLARLAAAPDAAPRLQELAAQGRLKPDALANIGQVFDKFSVPYTAEMYRAALVHGTVENIGKWSAQTFKITQPGALFKMSAALKAVESIALLGPNVGYPVRNLLNGDLQMALDGAWGLQNLTEIRGYMERMGISPARLYEANMAGEQALGKAGELLPGDFGAAAVEAGFHQITQAASYDGWLKDVQQFAGKIGSVMPATNVARKIERWQSYRAFYSGLSQMWRRTWRAGVGFTTMDRGLTQALGRIDARLPGMITAAIEGGLSPAEIKRSLLTEPNPLQVERFTQTVASKLGMDAGQVDDVLDDAGRQQLNTALNRPGVTREDVLKAFEAVKERRKQALEAMRAAERENVVEEITTKVATQGVFTPDGGIYDAMDSLHSNLVRTFYENMHQQVDKWDRILQLTDPDLKKQLIGEMTATGDDLFKHYFEDEKAVMEGVSEGLKQRPEIASYADDLKNSLTARQEAVKVYQAEQRKIKNDFFNGQYKSWEARDAAWKQAQLDLEQSYVKLIGNEVAKRRKFDNVVLKIAKTQTKDKARLAALADWQNFKRGEIANEMWATVDFRRWLAGQATHEKSTSAAGFREWLGQLPKEGKSKAWVEFDNWRLKDMVRSETESRAKRAAMFNQPEASRPTAPQPLEGANWWVTYATDEYGISAKSVAAKQKHFLNALNKTLEGMNAERAGAEALDPLPPFTEEEITRPKPIGERGALIDEVLAKRAAEIKARNASKGETPAEAAKAPTAAREPTPTAIAQAINRAAQDNTSTQTLIVTLPDGTTNRIQRQMLLGVPDDLQTLDLAPDGTIVRLDPRVIRKIADENGKVFFEAGAPKASEPSLPHAPESPSPEVAEQLERLGNQLDAHNAVSDLKLDNAGVSHPEVAPMTRAKLLADWQATSAKMDPARLMGHTPEEVANTVVEWYDRRAQKWAMDTGNSPEQWYANVDVQFGPTETQNAIRQAAQKGSMVPLEDGLNLMTVFAKGDLSTVVHESFHVFLEDLIKTARTLGPDSEATRDLAALERWAGLEPGRLGELSEGYRAKTLQGADAKTYVDAHEQIAKGGEMWLGGRRAESAPLARVFENFRQWLAELYSTLTKGTIGRYFRGVELTPEAADAYTHLFADLPSDRPVLEAVQTIEDAANRARVDDLGNFTPEAVETIKTQVQAAADEGLLRPDEAAMLAEAKTPEDASAALGVVRETIAREQEAVIDDGLANVAALTGDELALEIPPSTYMPDVASEAIAPEAPVSASVETPPAIETALPLAETPAEDRPVTIEGEAYTQIGRKPHIPERRSNERLRQVLDTPDEARTLDDWKYLEDQAMINPITGMRNLTAFNLAEHEHPAVIMALDADALKWANDNGGHPAGDQILNGIARAMELEGIDGYHFHGDEFYGRFNSPEDAALATARLTERLKLSKIVFEEIKDGQPTGNIIVKKGITYGHGIGADRAGAEATLTSNKQIGRAGRGVEPEGVYRLSQAEWDNAGQDASVYLQRAAAVGEEAPAAEPAPASEVAPRTIAEVSPLPDETLTPAPPSEQVIERTEPKLPEYIYKPGKRADIGRVKSWKAGQPVVEFSGAPYSTLIPGEGWRPATADDMRAVMQMQMGEARRTTLKQWAKAMEPETVKPAEVAAPAPLETVPSVTKIVTPAEEIKPTVEPHDLGGRSDEEFQAIVTRAREIQGRIIESGGMASKSVVEDELMPEFALDRYGAHQVTNFIEAQDLKPIRPGEAPEPSKPAAPKEPARSMQASEPNEAKAPWQMTQKEMLASDYYHMRYGAHTSARNQSELNAQVKRAVRGHRQDIIEAQKLFKPVPPEVLADYPDLMPAKPAAYTQPGTALEMAPETPFKFEPDQRVETADGLHGQVTGREQHGNGAGIYRVQLDSGLEIVRGESSLKLEATRPDPATIIPDIEIPDGGKYTFTAPEAVWRMVSKEFDQREKAIQTSRARAMYKQKQMNDLMAERGVTRNRWLDWEQAHPAEAAAITGETPAQKTLRELKWQGAAPEDTRVKVAENQAKAEYTLDTHKANIKRMLSGEATADDVRAAFQQFLDNQDVLRARLNAMTVDELKKLYRGYYRPDNKAGYVKSIMDNMAQAYTASTSLIFNPMKESLLEAIKRTVAEVTDTQIKEYADRMRAETEAKVKALTNPETLGEFETFVAYRGKDALTAEMKVRYDEVAALHNKTTRTEKAAYVGAVNTGNVEMTLEKGTHTKTGAPIFTVKLSGRVADDVYRDLNGKAKKLGGYYSRFSKGFLFTDENAANKFMALREGAVNVADELAAAKATSRTNVAQRLTAMADDMEAKANEALNRDRKVNTAKRANEAAGAEEAARGQIALAKTLRNLAGAIESGEATHLDGVTARTHVETLDAILNKGKYANIRAANDGYLSRNGQDLAGRPATVEDVAFAEYPYPIMHTGNLLSATREMQNVAGYKQTAAKLAKLVTDPNESIITVRPESIPALEELAEGLRRHNKKWDADYIDRQLQDYKRVQAMGLKTEPELRAALREYVQFRDTGPAADKVKALERDLVGTKIDGYFPTPRAIAEEMVNRADIRNGMTVWEPEAGKGSIADAVRDLRPGADVTVTEPVSRLRKILEAKGHKLTGSDMLEETGTYDRIVMNPPFENGQDVAHVMHAYEQLNPGGRLVAITGAHPFFANDAASVAFREWLDKLGATYEQMPEGSFKTSDRPTGVATYMVEIDKPGVLPERQATPMAEAPAFEPEALPPAEPQPMEAAMEAAPAEPAPVEPEPARWPDLAPADVHIDDTLEYAGNGKLYTVVDVDPTSDTVIIQKLDSKIRESVTPEDLKLYRKYEPGPVIEEPLVQPAKPPAEFPQYELKPVEAAPAPYVLPVQSYDFNDEWRIYRSDTNWEDGAKVIVAYKNYGGFENAYLPEKYGKYTFRFDDQGQIVAALGESKATAKDIKLPRNKNSEAMFKQAEAYYQQFMAMPPEEHAVIAEVPYRSLKRHTPDDAGRVTVMWDKPTYDYRGKKTYNTYSVTSEGTIIRDSGETPADALRLAMQSRIDNLTPEVDYHIYDKRLAEVVDQHYLEPLRRKERAAVALDGFTHHPESIPSEWGDRLSFIEKSKSKQVSGKSNEAPPVDQEMERLGLVEVSKGSYDRYDGYHPEGYTVAITENGKNVFYAYDLHKSKLAEAERQKAPFAGPGKAAKVESGGGVSAEQVVKFMRQGAVMDEKYKAEIPQRYSLTKEQADWAAQQLGRSTSEGITRNDFYQAWKAGLSPEMAKAAEAYRAEVTKLIKTSSMNTMPQSFMDAVEQWVELYKQKYAPVGSEKLLEEYAFIPEKVRADPKIDRLRQTDEIVKRQQAFIKAHPGSETVLDPDAFAKKAKSELAKYALMGLETIDVPGRAALEKRKVAYVQPGFGEAMQTYKPMEFAPDVAKYEHTGVSVTRPSPIQKEALYWPADAVADFDGWLRKMATPPEVKPDEINSIEDAFAVWKRANAWKISSEAIDNVFGHHILSSSPQYEAWKALVGDAAKQNATREHVGTQIMDVVKQKGIKFEKPEKGSKLEAKWDALQEISDRETSVLRMAVDQAVAAAMGKEPQFPYGWDENALFQTRADAPEGHTVDTDRGPVVVRSQGPDASTVSEALTGQEHTVKDAEPAQSAVTMDPDAMRRLGQVDRQPHEGAMAEAWWQKGAPVLDELRTQMLDELGRPPVKGYTTMDAATRAQLDTYLNRVFGQMTENKLLAQKWGEYKRDMALLNYSRRFNYNNYLGLVAPYEFWMTQSMAKWALRAIDRPAIFANYYRMRKFLDTMVQQPGFPSRLAGRVKIPMPFLPEWMGGGMWVDATNIGLPLDQFFAPWERANQTQQTIDKSTQYNLTDMLGNGDITQAQYDEAVATKNGAAWNAAYQKAAADSQFDGYDLASLMISPHLPIGWAMAAARGKQNTIAPLPATRQVRALTSALGIGGPGGVNIEAGVRKLFGLPIFDQWNDYRIDRELSNMTADGSITVRQAQAAMIERAGPVFDEAIRRSAQEMNVSAFASMAGVVAGVYPVGEERQRILAKLYTATRAAQEDGDTQPLQKFYDAYPEISAKFALNQTPEKRLQVFLVNAVQEGYYNLPRQYKRDFERVAGATFKQAFLDSNTRDYNAIPPETLASWAQALGQYVPANVDAPKLDVNYAPPEVARDVQAFYDARTARFGDSQSDNWKKLQALQGTYFAIPTDETSKLKVPDIALQIQEDLAALGDVNGLLTEYDALQTSKARTAYSKAHPAIGKYFDLVAYYKRQWPDYGDWIGNNGELKQGASDKSRDVYLAQYPELKEYWDWRKSWLATYPHITPYLTESQAATQAADTGTTDTTAPIEAPRLIADARVQRLATDYLYGGRPLTPAVSKYLRGLWTEQGGEGSFEGWLANTLSGYGENLTPAAGEEWAQPGTQSTP